MIRSSGRANTLPLNLLEVLTGNLLVTSKVLVQEDKNGSEDGEQCAEAKNDDVSDGLAQRSAERAERKPRERAVSKHKVSL